MRTRSGARQEPGAISLLSTILAGIPNRPRAACLGRWNLHDAIADNTATPHERAEAEALCRRCPHTNECPDSLEVTELETKESA